MFSMIVYYSKHYVIDFHKILENRQNRCRIIHFNDGEQSQKNSNCIITAHYGIWSFIPLFFFEQLKHFSNQYFLVVSILQVCALY